MRFNLPWSKSTRVTHEGGPAARPLTPLLELERAVASCLLGEPTFYESGNEVMERIERLALEVDPEALAAMAVQARNDWKLRHVPLFLCCCLAGLARGRGDGLVARTLEAVVQRPDEAPEFLAMYWRNGKRPLAKQVKRGLAAAMRKFDAYQLAKWDRARAIRLRDVLFLTHARPRDEAQAELWKQLVERSLPIPDTWEVALSSGADKKATWSRLLETGKLPYMAMLQNLRNMTRAGISPEVLGRALREGASHSKALPFRYVAAFRACPELEGDLTAAMLAALKGADRLEGMTYVVVDVSGSMDVPLARKSDLSRLDAAAALAVLTLHLTGGQCRIFTFSNQLAEVQQQSGLRLVTAIHRSQSHGGTNLRESLEQLQRKAPAPARLIVFTDEQSADGNGAAYGRSNYLINVATYKPGLELSGGWSRVNGFSERFVDWVRVHEALQ